jgi:hypothetical protein
MDSVDTLEQGEVCANIGARERRLRNQIGVAGAVLTLLTIGALIETHAAPLMRLIVLVPAFMSAMGFLQARARTCVGFARKGIRVLGDSRQDAQKVADDAMAKKIAAQARRVYAQATVAVAVLTLLVMAIP